MRKSILSLLLVLLLTEQGPGAAAVEAFHARISYVSYISYEEARPILEALSEAVPAGLRSASSQGWTKWVASRDAEIRSRLVQGDEDSLMNFLLFGTSFTRHPRVTLDALAQLAGRPLQSSRNDLPDTVALKAINSRADDLVKAMIAPGNNERLVFARMLVESKGGVKTPTARERVKQYLVANLARVLNQQVTYAKILESARLIGDASAEFVERSKLYSTRGLSSDTSLLPNFAIEKSLASIKARGLLAPASVRRVAIIGPGLDFTDKQDGYDFYPQQTIQPFAIIDTLLRLGLASVNNLRVTTFDLSPRVNDHLRRARERGSRGASYTIQLPRNGQAGWKQDAIDYWTKFGNQIGTAATPAAVPAGVGDVKVRAVRVRPSVAALITPEDVNIVLQRLELPAGQGFDLIIATNIFVYYDVFEQSLALANVARMLRAGGFLLSNNALPELPASGMRSVDYETVVYSDKPNDGDHVVWYQRVASN
jgi:hypothetical protein